MSPQSPTPFPDVEELIAARDVEPSSFLEAAASYIIVADAIVAGRIATCIHVARDNWPFALCAFFPNEDPIPNVRRARRLLDAAIERLERRAGVLPDRVTIDIRNGYELAPWLVVEDVFALELTRVPGAQPYYRDHLERTWLKFGEQWRIVVTRTAAGVDVASVTIREGA